MATVRDLEPGSGAMNVALLLVPAFVAVGLWLLYYTRRRRRLMRRVAHRHGFVHHERDRLGLEARLNRALSLQTPRARSFSAFRDIVQADGVTLFRATELLDLSRHGQAQNTHFGRIAATFETPPEADFHVLADRNGGLSNLDPARGRPDGDAWLHRLERVLADSPPPHALSVTARDGVGLAYLEPRVTGSESERDVEYLWRFARAYAASAP